MRAVYAEKQLVLVSYFKVGSVCWEAASPGELILRRAVYAEKQLVLVS